MTPAERHNALARMYVEKIVRGTQCEAEFMVVVESVLLASFLVLQKRYQHSPAAAVEMVELAMQNATARLSGQESGQ